MLLHCTKKLAAKLPRELFKDAALAASEGEHRQLGEWHGHRLILDCRQCVLFCHDLTRYVLFPECNRVRSCNHTSDGHLLLSPPGRRSVSLFRRRPPIRESAEAQAASNGESGLSILMTSGA